MKPIIKVENLSKQYRLGGEKKPYSTLRESLVEAARKPLKAFQRQTEQNSSSFWALRDISFNVMPGEVVGIIGRNGAGKSTLLKILSRITEPTLGQIELYGRVGSLLEVGTGFHPELTGRENIFLNGAILGMRREEIASKFDEIVDFAEVEKFLDTPVKHYSSGMYTRLAFAVAANLEPEILIVDEVLAVGDIEFQKKCFGKMSEVSKQGRTVLIVSHNMGSIINLCSQAILLRQGQKVAEGTPSEVVTSYLDSGIEASGEFAWATPGEAPGNDNIRLKAVRIISQDEVTTNVDIQSDVRVEIDFWNLKPGAEICTSIHLLDQKGDFVLASANMHSANLIVDDWFNKPHPVGVYRTSCVLPKNFLNEGQYRINAIVLTNINQVEARADEILSFTVHDTGAMRKEFGGGWVGVVRPRLAWQTKQLEEFGDSRELS
jgi:lipopolysaccharide transport system ATP-binding protein